VRSPAAATERGIFERAMWNVKVGDL